MKQSQISSNVSAFKVPIAPQPQPPQAEMLLFNDILEEKTTALRNTLTECLQVMPYRSFSTEFDNFLKTINKRIQEVRRSGTNNSRLINSTQMASIYSRPSSSFNCRPGMSMMSSHRNSTLRLPESSNFQPIESLNPFKPPENYNFQPRVVLPRLDNSAFIPHETSICATVIEVSQVQNGAAEKNNININNFQPSEPKDRSQSPMPNLYSDVTMDENIAHDAQPMEDANDASNSIESLLEDVGFKIVLGIPNNSKSSQKSNASKNYENHLNKTKGDEKFLSMWSVNIKLIKLNTTKAVLILTGALLENDRVTIIEQNHNAGIIEARKEFNLIKTKNGLYRLIGNIVGRNSSKELYEACLAVNGIPRLWKSLTQQVSGAAKKSKKAMLNFSLDSPAGPSHGPMKSIKTTKNLDMSMTRKGTAYSKNMSSKTNNKRKLSEYNLAENSKQGTHPFHDNLPASTPKRPKKTHAIFQTPSQILKNKLVKNINKANSRLGTINDSINVTKRRQSNSKEQSVAFSKPKTPEKSSLIKNNTTKCSTQTPVNSSSVSKNVNSTTGSKSKTSQNSTEKTFHSYSTKEQSKLKSTINSTKSPVNNVDKSVGVKGKQNTSNHKSLSKKNVSDKEINKSAKKKQICSKDVSRSNSVVSKNILKIDKNTSKQEIKNKLVQNIKSSLKKQGQGLFDGEEEACNSNDDFNFMASPSKLSVASRTDKSRSETPPLFGHQWSTTAKSLVISEPPTPLSKSDDAKALKRRVKAPKITLNEELKNNKKSNKKQSIDYKTASEKINNMLQFGEQYDSDDD